jgi:hypothetical protein
MSDTNEILGWKNKWECAVEMAARAEVERDEAREKYATEATEHMLAVNKLANERDEAREELYDIRLNLGEDAEGYTLTHAVCVLQQERDEARDELNKILKNE